jgi:hypothetical protein
MTQLEHSIDQMRLAVENMTTMQIDCISDKALRQLKEVLRDGQDTLNELAQDRILRGIKAGFEDMSYRYQEISTAFEDTFEWVLDLHGESVEATKFAQWLSFGDGIFHICGKLGSGKSTLSKWRSICSVLLCLLLFRAFFVCSSHAWKCLVQNYCSRRLTWISEKAL